MLETHVDGSGGAVPGTGDVVHDVRIPNCNTPYNGDTIN